MKNPSRWWLQCLVERNGQWPACQLARSSYEFRRAVAEVSELCSGDVSICCPTVGCLGASLMNHTLYTLGIGAAARLMIIRKEQSVKVDFEEKVTAHCRAEGGLVGDAICEGQLSVCILDCSKADLACFRLAPAEQINLHPAGHHQQSNSRIYALTPGQIGWDLNMCTGIVKSVEVCGQEADLGIKAKMVILDVDGYPFTRALLETRLARDRGFAVRLGEENNPKYKVHPNFNKALVSTSVLELRDGSRPYKANMSIPILKWRRTGSDETFLPIALNCTLTPTADGSRIVVQFALIYMAVSFEDVVISVFSNGCQSFAQNLQCFDWHRCVQCQLCPLGLGDPTA